LINKDPKLWIFGDSFSGEIAGENSWHMLLYKKWDMSNVTKMVRYSQPSIDVHTIIDTFISNLYLIKETDFVAIILPSISRARFSHKEYISDNMDIAFPLTGSHWMHLKNGVDIFTKDSKINAISFAGDGSIDKNILKSKIEPPMGEMKYKDFVDIADIMKLLNSSKAEVDSINKILYSLKEISKCPLYIMSWADDLDNSIVDTKSVLTEGIGHWETKHDLYLRGDKNGFKNDSHWSEQMNIDVANYIIKKYPTYLYFKGNI
jgi:hypothetical protein